jgi:hypothetical protein
MTWRPRRDHLGTSPGEGKAMTGQSVPYGIPDPVPLQAGRSDAPDRAPELSARQCTRCGAISTHYLTCPGLRLPPGYRLSADRGD